GYEMVGIPDGLGARQEGDDVVINMNHELRSTQGIFRLHGAKGAFVSRLVLDPETNRIVAGEDFIQPEVQFFNYLTGAVDDTPSPGGTRGDGKVFPPQTVEFNRFCSSSLTDDGQLFNGRSGRGYLGQIYFANEEAGDEGRVFGVTEDGQARQLSRLGLFSWEQTVAAANFTDTTLVMGTEDTAIGQLWAYNGRKLAAGSPFARAGLLNGRNNVVRLDDGDLTTVEPTDDAGFRTAYDKGAAVPFTLTDVEWNQSGADQNAEAAAEGLTLNRIEDGAFDPNSPNDFYFLTTEGGENPNPSIGGGGGGLWKLSYTDIEQPQLGGTLTLLLDGTESVGLQKPDNMDIDSQGNLLIQEDPGGSDAIARILAYRLSDGAIASVAQCDANLFGAGAENQITNDEESSGIIDVADLLGEGTFLFDAQVHTSTGLPPGSGEGTVEEYVERGQLLRMTVSNWSKVYPSAP
ncbi:MAG: DUF839 domain-containing protein, partial [Actinomycetota bacterium]|nr:DUF839 domain-containing protein [Actinomycetota bacterium]